MVRTGDRRTKAPQEPCHFMTTGNHASWARGTPRGDAGIGGKVAMWGSGP